MSRDECLRQLPDILTGEVTKVTDGDTLRIDIKCGNVSTRLIGVDTPETVSPTIPDQCFGEEASEFVKQTVALGATITLELGVDHIDRYDRLLGYVYLADGTFLNAELARLGFANVLTVGDNDQYANTFRNLVAEAKSQNLGLWAACPGIELGK